MWEENTQDAPIAAAQIVHDRQEAAQDSEKEQHDEDDDEFGDDFDDFAEGGEGDDFGDFDEATAAAHPTDSDPQHVSSISNVLTGLVSSALFSSHTPRVGNVLCFC